MQRVLELSYDKIIIGISMDALRLSQESNIPIIFLRNNKPTIYNFNLDDTNLKLYNNLINGLCLKSLILFSGLLFAIRIENNTIIATTISNILIKISFNQLYIADDYKVEGLPGVISKTSTKNFVTDFFKIDNVSLFHTIDFSLNDDIIKNIIFYKKNNYSKAYDCYTTSIIDDKKLEDFDFSQTYIKVKLTSLFSDNGFPKIRLISEQRIIKPLGKNIYDELPNNISII